MVGEFDEEADEAEDIRRDDLSHGLFLEEVGEKGDDGIFKLSKEAFVSDSVDSVTLAILFVGIGFEELSNTMALFVE
jgi:hypothetical protein